MTSTCPTRKAVTWKPASYMCSSSFCVSSREIPSNTQMPRPMALICSPPTGKETKGKTKQVPWSTFEHPLESLNITHTSRNFFGKVGRYWNVKGVTSMQYDNHTLSILILHLEWMSCEVNTHYTGFSGRVFICATLVETPETFYEFAHL